VVVADGHAGTDASHFAVERLLERFAPEWTDGLAPTSADAWRATATRAFAELNAAILERASERGGEPARTTLVAALVRPDDDLLAFASMGDSHLFRIGDRGAEDLAERPGQRPAFLGFDGETPEQLAEKCAIGWLPLHAARALALVSDGLSERGIGVADPARAVVDAHHEALALDAPLRPAALARGIAERALAAQRRQRSGDNLASAVLLLG
jgi:serine/threonine protein phosphatase PrpC